ncbi:MAG TPA: hemerythrin domain-containing protein [Gammaproteobacteria bacterium]|nr:hemerythrin domain-containing protein [Gammaproteobacteria bacterium]
MISIPILLSTGHRLINALLMETQAAFDEGAWAAAQGSFAEFALRLETHMSAEESVLFPRIAAHSPDSDAELAQCRREHENLRAQIQTAATAVDTRERARCYELMAQLSDALSRHFRDEEKRLYPFAETMDEDDLDALARALDRPGDEGGPRDGVLPADSGVH